MPSSVYSYERDLARIQCLQFFAIADRYQPVLRAMQYIGMAIHFRDPPVGSQVKAQNVFDGKYREKALDRFFKTEIRSIEY